MWFDHALSYKSCTVWKVGYKARRFCVSAPSWRRSVYVSLYEPLPPDHNKSNPRTSRCRNAPRPSTTGRVDAISLSSYLKTTVLRYFLSMVKRQINVLNYSIQQKHMCNSKFLRTVCWASVLNWVFYLYTHLKYVVFYIYCNRPHTPCFLYFIMIKFVILVSCKPIYSKKAWIN